jgi:hypothetical protein
VGTAVVDGTRLRLDFAGLPTGEYFVKVAGVVAPGGAVVGAYNLIPALADNGTLRLNLAGAGSASVSLAGLNPNQTYLIQVTSPNHVPTIYSLDFGRLDRRRRGRRQHHRRRRPRHDRRQR